jgi:hypothetical protein
MLGVQVRSTSPKVHMHAPAMSHLMLLLLLLL